MSDSAQTVSRTVDEMAGRVRRFLGAIDPRDPAVNPIRIRETVISALVVLAHDLGYDSRTESDALGNQEFSFALAVGEFRTAEVANNEIVALGKAYNNQTNIPMEPVDRWVLEREMLNDIRATGAVQKGTPREWAPEIYFDQADGKVKYRFKVYPAASVQTTVVFPHTVFNMEIITGTSPSMLSYLAHEAWMKRAAASLASGLSPENYKRLGLSPEWVREIRAEANDHVKTAREANWMHAMSSTVQETQA